jgi:hypothetical protein
MRERGIWKDRFSAYSSASRPGPAALFLGERPVFRGLKGFVFLPVLLPLGFDDLKGIFCHDDSGSFSGMAHYIRLQDAVQGALQNKRTGIFLTGNPAKP